jgi:catechol 2,3-dioxygenase-like lactoylglutathione lyase family enzyme
MIIGTHILFYTKDPEADRIFFRDVLGFPSVDAGEGWLLFALPPAEAAFHPADPSFAEPGGGQARLRSVIYFMCDDLKSFVATLEKKNVRCGECHEAGWGTSTTIPLPSGASIGLYQPRHETAFQLKSQ